MAVPSKVANSDLPNKDDKRFSSHDFVKPNAQASARRLRREGGGEDRRKVPTRARRTSRARPCSKVMPPIQPHLHSALRRQCHDGSDREYSRYRRHRVAGVEYSSFSDRLLLRRILRRPPSQALCHWRRHTYRLSESKRRAPTRLPSAGPLAFAMFSTTTCRPYYTWKKGFTTKPLCAFPSKTTQTCQTFVTIGSIAGRICGPTLCFALDRNSGVYLDGRVRNPVFVPKLGLQLLQNHLGRLAVGTPDIHGDERLLRS